MKMDLVRKILGVDEADGAEIVERDDKREVRMSYHTGCHNYTIGVATAFFMAATVLAYLILWEQHIPESVYTTAVPFFVAFSAAGFCLVGVAYVAPVRFYELMEGDR